MMVNGAAALTNKVAIVTGGANGMGAAHARALVAAGARVLIADVTDEAGHLLAAELGEAAHFVHLDVTSTDEWTTAVAAAEAEFGGVDVLVNNAGILGQAPIWEYEDSAWERIISINLTGQFKGIRAVVPSMRARGAGSIINVSSTAGLKGFAGTSAYNASKFGIRGLTKSVALELAPFNIRVNSVHPGNVQTAMIDGLYADYPHVPMHRAAQVEEIAAMVLFLAGDTSSFSTGAEFIADGGETAGQPDVFA